MDVGKEIAKIQQFIRQQVEESQSDGLVIGLSGGIDSTVAAYLSVGALGRKKVFGVLLPSHTTPDGNQEETMEIVGKLGIVYTRIPIADIIQSFGKYLPEFEEGSSTQSEPAGKSEDVYPLLLCQSEELLGVRDHRCI